MLALGQNAVPGLAPPGTPRPAAPASHTHGEYRDFALSHQGEAARGKALFADLQKIACTKCHTVDGTGSHAGPDLFAIGDKFPREELIHSVLEPSSTIAVGYGSTRITTKADDDFQGIVKQVTGDWIEMMVADGKPVRIATKDIAAQRTSDVSLMPEGLEAGLTLQEFDDLVAYLQSLRQPMGALGATPGAPEIIAPAARPATFRPFFGDTVRFSRPLWFGQLPGSSNMFVVLEHGGKSWLIERRADEVDRQSSLVDLSKVVRVGGATGLLGLAFHPRFRENRKYYLKYQIDEAGRISTLVVERQFNADFTGDSGLPARPILKIASSTQDHNGGCLEFGPDGYLYLGMGDTGPQGDPQGHGQDLSLLLGKILRLDVDHADNGLPYGIPSDNPFRGQPGVRPEIWACGLREPWRFTFDPATGDLWVGDVGQDHFEEVAIVRSGENHGWNVFEGFANFSDRYRRTNATYTPPVFSYSHRHGVCVTGGYVYRGRRAPALHGWYLCGDFETRRLWALTQQNRQLGTVVEIGRAPSRFAAFGQDRDGELYLVGYDSGVVYHLDLDSVDPTPLDTRVLAETSEKVPVPWRYTFQAPAAGWFQPDFNASTWGLAPGGFGTAGTPGATVRTEWRTVDIWVRREFSLPTNAAPALPQNLALRLHHDEDAEVYLNGVEAARVPGWTSGYIDVPLASDAAHALRPGRNVLAIHCHQVSGGQYLDAGLVEYVPAKPK